MFAARNLFLVGSAPPPTFSAISPSSATVGSTVTITGSNFVSGRTSVSIGGSNASNVNVSSASSLTCTVPSQARGLKSVVVTTPGGSVSASGVFTVVTPPTFISISPASGKSGTSVTITGSNFLSGATVSIGGSAASNVSVVNSSTITCTVPALGSQGGKSVTVNTSDGSVTSGTVFTFYLAPTVSGVSPTSFKAGDTITVTGTNFAAGNTTVSFSNGSAASNVSVSSSTSLTCTVPSISAGQSLAIGVTVTTPGGSASTSANALTYYPAPTFSSVSVPQGTAGLVLTVTGSGFSGTVTATVGGVAASVSVSSPTSLNLTIPTISGEGAKNIVVTTPGGFVTGVNFFTYYNTYSPVTTNYTNAGSFTFTIPVWCNKIDIIAVGGGQGGEAGTVGVTGRGGAAGSWSSTTLTRGAGINWSTATITGTVGAGGVKGAQFTYGTLPPAGGASTAASYVTAAGGSGGNGTSISGGSPGNHVRNGVTYTGGVGGFQAGQDGGAPGGGGYGGGIFNGVGGNGGRGAVWFRCYQ